MKTVGALDSVGTLMDGNAILYASPSFERWQFSFFQICLLTENGDAATGEGGVAAQSSTYDSGMGLGVDVTYGGLSVGAFADEVKAAQGAQVTNIKEMLCQLLGTQPLWDSIIGYQTGGLDRGLATATAATVQKL